MKGYVFIIIPFTFMPDFSVTIKYFFRLLFVFGVCSCSDDPPRAYKPEKYLGSYSKKYSRISIENGPRQGFQFLDSLGTEYNYRYITTTITNDSIVPIHLEISFSKEYNDLRRNNSLKSKVFLLPRELTPERQQFDNSMSKELKLFLDKHLDDSISLDKIVNPNERLVMTFGVLNEERYGEFMRMELMSSDRQFHLNAGDSIINQVDSSMNPSTIYLALNLVNSFIIPCGRVSYSKH